MKKILLFLAAFVSAMFLAAPTQAQMPARIGSTYYASNYGKWSGVTFTGNAAAGAGSVVMLLGDVTLPDGRDFVPFNANAPISIDTATLRETVTPSAVSGCNTSKVLGTCVITATFSNVHGAQAIVSSGTFGLQEAINDAAANGGGVVVVDASWAGSTSNITSASLPSSVTIEDKRAATEQFWALRPTAVTLIAAPAAPTVTTTTGSLTSGAYFAKVAYVDAVGGVSLASTDSVVTAATTGLIITSPAATTGAVGYLPYITAAGGAAGSEILAASPITSANCTLSTLESVIPACAIGASATVTAANPSATAKPVVESNAFVTMGPVSFGTPPAPFVNSYPFGIFVATATLNNSNADAAQFLVPAGYFNTLGKAWEVCVKGGTATQVLNSLLTVNPTMANQYAQSPVTVSSLAFPTQTQAAAGTFEGCVTLQTSTTGASGKFWASSSRGPWANFLNTAPATQVVTADASAAASSAIDLTKNIWVAVNLAGAGAANITVPIINSVSIQQVQ